METFTTSLVSAGYALVQPASELVSRFGGVEAKPVHILRSPYAGPHGAARVRGAKPYKGPELAELWITRDVPLDRSGRSTLEVEGPGCPACDDGERLYTILGAEQEVKGPPRGRELYTWVRQDRQPGMGIFVPESQLQGDSFFTYGGYFRYCTQEAKEHIEDEDWTGIEFFEVGEIVPG